MKSVTADNPAVSPTLQEFQKSGFHIVDKLLSDADCAELAAECDALLAREQTASARKRGGVRNLLRLSKSCAKFSRSARVIGLLRELTGAICFPVRSIYFDKTPGTNWSVPWHQDLAIAVARRIDTPGFGPWSLKAGVVHVQPPCNILADMVALRIHFDDCDANNGALKIIPGSHCEGELSSQQIESWLQRGLTRTCEIPKGGALLMRPLLLHVSAAAANPSHRRVLHIEYAAQNLPNGLQWAEQP